MALDGYGDSGMMEAAFPGMQPPMPMDATAAPEKVIDRDPPDVTQERKELVKDWLKKVAEAKVHWGTTFKQMRDDARFAAGKQWPGAENSTAVDDRYVANVTLRHINQRVAATYAKNPRVRAIRRPKLYFQVWDGSPEMLQMAAAGLPDPMTAASVMQEYQAAQEKKKLYDRMGKTLEYVAQYSMDEPVPKFKTQLKQCVRRALTCKVGYVKLGYQRLMQYDASTIDSRMKDITDRMEHLKMLAADLADGEIQPDSKEAEALKLNLDALQKQKSVIAREGIVFSFPKAWSIIPDTAVTQLKGFVGAGWLAEEYLLTTDKIKTIYKKDIGSNFRPYNALGTAAPSGDKGKHMAAVYEIHDITGQLCFTVCEGYDDFLIEPTEPSIKLEQFHPIFCLYFNDTEDPDSVYPPSNVELARPMQVDYNRGREGLRVHRQANRPATVTANGVLDDASKEKLSNHADHEIITTNLSKNDDINKVLGPKPTSPIQPELYDVDHAFVDLQRALGDQEADMGGTSGATATEATIAQTSRASGLESNRDDLDEFLTDLMRATGQTLLLEMSADTVRKIAGPAAVWPEMSAQDVAEELLLEVRAGSSGRPNRGARIAAIEKVAPFLLQIPGMKPKRLVEFMLTEIDEGLDIEDFHDDLLPSIVAANNMAKPNMAPGPGSAAQGAQGGMNAAGPGESSAKGQNMHPGAAEQAPA